MVASRVSAWANPLLRPAIVKLAAIRFTSYSNGPGGGHRHRYPASMPVAPGRGAAPRAVEAGCLGNPESRPTGSPRRPGPADVLYSLLVSHLHGAAFPRFPCREVKPWAQSTSW